MNSWSYTFKETFPLDCRYKGTEIDCAKIFVAVKTTAGLYFIVVL